MSADRFGFNETRFMPAPVEERVIAVLSRAAGVVMMLAVAALWASLVTWSVNDPSLSHSTGSAVRNLTGPLGAILSDLLLQTLGLGAAILTLAPMFWAIELARGGRVHDLRIKAAYVPLSVLLLAGALSSLPESSNWPLNHGLGGMIGDVIFQLTSSAIALITWPLSKAIAAVLLATAGLWTVTQSLGIALADLKRSIASFDWPQRAPADAATSWHHNLRAEASRLRERLHPAAAAHATGGMVARADGYAPQAYFAAANPHHSMHQPVYYPNEAPGVSEAEAFLPDSANDWQPPRREPSFSPPPIRAPASWPEPGQDVRAQQLAAAAVHQHFPAEQAPVFQFEDDDVITDSSERIAQRFAAVAAKNPAIPSPPASPAMRRPAFLREFKHRQPEPAVAPAAYKRPQLALLKRAQPSRAGAELSQTALRGTARLLEDVLNDFGVKGEMRDVRPGPVVTLFEFEPARGTKTSRIVALAEDIARSMSVASVRVAVVPGRSVIGIELPNVKRETVMLRDMLEADAYRNCEGALPIVLGKSIGGDAIVADLARMPHLLVAGTTGSGKSVGVNAMILSLLYRHGPDRCRMLMIDPKMLELSVYNGIPHLLTPVVTDPAKAVSALNWAVGEMDERYKAMSKVAVRNIEAYNLKLAEAGARGEMPARTVHTGYDPATGEAVFERDPIALRPMPYIVIVVDEFADLMAVAGKDIEGAVQRLAQMARAAGIHLIMATQRPSVDIITGTIKANFPTRISFKVTSKIDSRTILNEQGAEQLLGNGDMLYAPGTGQTVRVHGPFVSDVEVEAIAHSLRELGEPDYVDGICDQPAGIAGTPFSAASRADSDDDLYDRAVALVMRDQKASTSYIQRRLSIGYNRAADLIERMQAEGLVSAPSHGGKREILISHS